MILSVEVTFALGVLFPVFMTYFDENREKTGECCHLLNQSEFYNPTGIALAGNFDVSKGILACLFFLWLMQSSEIVISVQLRKDDEE